MRALFRVSLAAAVVAGCSADRHRRPTIGVVIPTDSGDLSTDLRRGMALVADSLQLDVRVVTAGGDGARQAAQVDSFTARRVAAIVIDPVDASAVGDAIARANRVGIPVFTMVTPTNQGSVVSHVGSDDRMAGELVGWYVGQRLNGGGSIAILDQPSVPSVRDRVAGIRLALTRFPNVRIVAMPAVEPPPAAREAASRRTASLLAADQRVDAVVGTSDGLALGALDAVQASGKTGVFVVGFGAIPEARAAIVRGSALVADVIPDPVTIGRYALLVAASHLRGNQVMTSVPVRVRLVDRDSLGTP